MGEHELLAQQDPPFDPAEVEINDADVLDLLEPVVREWWVEEFGGFVPDNGGFFTPPQKEAIPLIHEKENALICSPTGSGKCVKPDTPLITNEDGMAKVRRASELLDHRQRKLADVDRDGELYTSDIKSYSLTDSQIETRDSHVYSESYEGTLYRIETTYGRTVEVTPDHPLLVETSGGPEWRRAGDIAEGDRIGVPREIDLPDSPVQPEIQEAIDRIESRYPLVLSVADSDRLAHKLSSTDSLDDLSETERRQLLALSGLSTKEMSERLNTSLSTICDNVTGGADSYAEEMASVLQSELVPLAENELLVRTDTGRISRFSYPDVVDEDIAMVAAFVLAEGFVGGSDSAGQVEITEKPRTELLERTREVARERFGKQFQKGTEKDYVIDDDPFTVFVSTLLDIESGAGQAGQFPDWVLNAPKSVKRSFVSTVLSRDAEIREDEVRVRQASELRAEQLTYLLLSFGILPARDTTSECATNTESQRDRDCYGVTVRGMEDLRALLSEFDIRHSNISAIEEHVAGTRSGTHVRSGRTTDRSLSRLESELETLPDGGAAAETEKKSRPSNERNVVWLAVTDKSSVSYDGQIIDLTVPDTHNFVGGRGALYLHNTLASFAGIINELFRRGRESGLENSVYCLYVSPLKSLANDIHRNLEVPLAGITDKLGDRGEDVELRHAIRHGDTDDSERQAMLEETPHILNTTPETLAILLNSPKFKKKLETVEYVIVDEIHSLAENKRGTHLSVSLERLEAMAEGSPTRVGCSATVEPLEGIAEFLVGQQRPGGPPREYELVDARFVREFDIELTCPTDDLLHTPGEEVNARLYEQLHGLIQEHTNTLVFTNTRSGAERVLHNLRERFGYDEDDSGCHHGSLSRAQRQSIEEDLKAGDVDVVTTSTSLELGVDMPHLDLVVQVGSPKSVAALLQRVGRAGHQLGETVTGRVVALDRDELVECAVMLKKAQEGFVDRVFVPENAQDVAAQQVYGMAINGPRPEREVRAILRRAHPYRTYGDDDLEQLFRYLTADYEGLEEKNVYAKIWRDTNDPPDGEHHYEEFDVGERLIGKRGRLARVIYMTNIGTIPDSFTCGVVTRSGDEWVGQLDEEYLDTLETGDVFVLGGDRLEFRYRRGSKVYVDRTNARPTVPSWFSERLPLSYDLGREILSFQGELLGRLASGGRPELRGWLREFPLDENSVRAIVRTFDEQVRYAGRDSVSTDGRLVIEEELDHDAYERRYYVHSNYGRRFNDGFSRLLAYRCAREANANVTVAVADHGFTLSLPLNRKVDIAGVVGDLDPSEVRADLRASLEGTDLLERYFRINATRALMILKRYKGHEKSASQQQVNSDMLLGFARGLDEFAVVEETYREILEDKLAVAGLEEVLAEIRRGEVDVVTTRVDSPSPRAFGLATLMASDVVLAEDESAVLREFHQRVLEDIEDGTGGAAVTD